MLKHVVWIAAIIATGLPSGRAETKLGDATIVFAAADQGRQILATRDDFVQRMSPFDRAARLKTDRVVSEAEYLEYAARSARDWSPAERAKIEAVAAAVAPKLARFRLPLPPTIHLVRTTGQEEGGAFYTRGTAIMFPTRRLDADVDELQQVFCHELFHVISRANPELKEALYHSIGYEKCNEAILPSDLALRKITNPDAPRNDHCIKLRFEGRELFAVPILYSRTEQYDASRGGEFFNYLEFRFMAVVLDSAGNAAPYLHEGRPLLAEPAQVAGLFEQIGRNTQYIIHPEEVLADNFAMLVLETQPKSPEILQKIAQALPAN